MTTEQATSLAVAIAADSIRACIRLVEGTSIESGSQEIAQGRYLMRKEALNSLEELLANVQAGNGLLMKDQEDTNE